MSFSFLPAWAAVRAAASVPCWRGRRKEAGALVLAFVTLPFDCEGNRREAQAQRPWNI